MKPENTIIKRAIEVAGGQKQLAEKSGVSQAAIHKLLRRKSKDIRLSTVLAISKATSIPVEEFF
jgi:DNA-binding Xre family transcriptional regulator